MSHLLLVSTAPIVSELLSTLLQRAGSTVHVAPDVARAFLVLEQYEITTIICDLLPRHHASSVCAALQAHPTARSLPLVLLTPYHLPDARVVADVHAVIVKPFPILRLLAVLHREHGTPPHGAA